MIRHIIIGVWTCCATLGATYTAYYYRIRPSQITSTPNQSHPKTRDLKTITVPVIRDSQIRGYISADFSIICEETDQHQPALEFDGYVLDEAYRMIYSQTDIDFDTIQKTDLNQLISDIKSRVNHRLQREAIQDILIRSFHYVPREDLQK